MAVFDPALRPVRRVLCFGAHPDDLDFGASGTVAAWTAAGVHVEYCIMTDGDAGGFDDRTAEEITEMRHAEQRAAAALVGVHTVHFMGERDGFLEPTHAVMKQVVELIRTVRPDVVLAMHPERNWARIQRSHPDHLACGEAVTRAIYPAVENPFSYPELEAAGLAAYKLPWLWLYGSPTERENHAVDITSVFELKLEALRQHLSQHPDVPAMERYVRTQCLAKGREYGMKDGALAEAFHVVAVNAADTIAGF
ncbi:PIG-L deacetylase family protein [Paeniglutamicibacter kerguelensis]|uniref:LmbE family N-acetylglucosaminyl deacetylase n=1 Tax=Paeniglutamicibacter kerguelensis TaxID=254788 RepID=A0ABS4XE85_9MICC|nr:PIG-L deacetylase family protein [Paeniglutamicibacter kerguelensis]MBP2386703.1 LmbE family N-acetylglucosaminyl deacetylase [Paeniglutamicibacter kerguelensis]